jgi:hypothetical protein
VEKGATIGMTALVIDSYIAAYIQMQHRVIGVHPAGLTVARGLASCVGAVGPGRAKTSLLGRKTVPGPSSSSAGEEEGEETSGSENETRLVAAGPPGCEPGGLWRQRRLPGVESAAVQALMQLTAITSSRDPTQMVKERGPRRRTA